MLTIAAFLFALGLLIAIHEYGHYRMARWCGVKVLKFSVGFGKALISWTPKGSSTEFVIGVFPLGGFVKMLDEREGPVPLEERHLAFNTQPLRSRAAIVAAGPLANLLLAVLIYAAVNWSGIDQAKPILSSPSAGSLADRAGLKGGELVKRAGVVGESPQDIESYEALRWLITRAALDSRDVMLFVGTAERTREREFTLQLSGLKKREIDAEFFQAIGMVGPRSVPVIGQVLAGGAAEMAGLQNGDVVLKIGSTEIVDGQQLRTAIRNSVKAEQMPSNPWVVRRGNTDISIEVMPLLSQEGSQSVGRIGAYVGAAPEMTVVSYGFVEGLYLGVQRTWEVSLLSLKMMGRMLIGEASIKNLSGPLTIADYAGKSASLGWIQYFLFVALISVSLGVLNLLPLPVLDGGHLMYYLWEAVTGRTVSDAWTDRLQRGGVAVLMVMMSIAIFNDLTRLLG